MQRVVGLNPTQGSSFFLKKGCSGGVELFAFALHITLYRCTFDGGGGGGGGWAWGWRGVPAR